MEEKPGSKSSKGGHYNKYDPAFKVMVVEYMRSQKISYNETGRMFLPGISRGSAVTIIQKWESIYLESGSAGLRYERRGRKPSGPPKPKKLSEMTEKDLIEENQYLRMELEYLKKLEALVSKRELSERKKSK